ncbi:unnamed protein product, partial [Rhizoctonia solani]
MSDPNFGHGNNELIVNQPDAHILKVEYNDRKLYILRNNNYKETVASIKKSVCELRTTTDDQIILLEVLEGVDDCVQITEEVWEILLPRLRMVRVELSNIPPQLQASPSTESAARTESRRPAEVERARTATDEESVAVETTPTHRIWQEPTRFPLECD